ncbi:hypothetical protein F511_40363 [Dorcoceras hygrometricum]|uniref:Uncharacterized protein n=1 Tax=Dorcoceras hygrometricum TaxID=472368 RepID=A0A2Z7C8P8_9LAMI|nr:hypothetical protein F511_40363 [Dorcoceras hygrometricum]
MMTKPKCSIWHEAQYEGATDIWAAGHPSVVTVCYLRHKSFKTKHVRPRALNRAEAIKKREDLPPPTFQEPEFPVNLVEARRLDASKSNAIIGVVTVGFERLIPSSDRLMDPEYHGPMIFTG